MKRLTSSKSLEVVSRHRGGMVEVVNERGEMRMVNPTDLGRVVEFSISSSARIVELTREGLEKLREERLKI